MCPFMSACLSGCCVFHHIVKTMTLDHIVATLTVDTIAAFDATAV
jgi:hypothetical protein